MRRYRHSAVLVAGMLFVLPSLSSAQDIDVAPPEIDFSFNLDTDLVDVEVGVQLAPGDPIPDVDVTLSIDIPDIPDFAEAPPEVDFSFNLDTDLFEVEVEVQLAPGDPIPDVDVTLKSKVGGSNPPPPPPDDECTEDGCG